MSTSTVSNPTQSSDLSFLWLEITERCNLECLHCYAQSSPVRPLRGVLTTSDWTAVLEQAAAIGCRRVQFIGGEPTLHPDLSTMLRVAKDLDYSFIEVFSNLTTVTERFLSSCRISEVSLATSFYSSRPDVHDGITGRRGSFDQTVNGIRRALANDVRLRVGLVDHGTADAELRATIALLRDLGVVDYRVDRVRGIGRAAAIQQRADPMAELCGRCADSTLCMTSSGVAYPCVMSRCAPLGHAKDGLTTLLHGASLADFRKRLRSQLHLSNDPARCLPRDVCEPTCSPPVILCSPAEMLPCAPRRPE